MNHYIEEIDIEMKKNKQSTVIRLIWQVVKQIAHELEQIKSEAKGYE